jgi:putative methionine-R-sulfoxide reductase with GAF domain
MKVLHNRSWRELAIYALAAMLLILISELLILRKKLNDVIIVETHKDFTRSAQVDLQQIAYALQAHHHGQPALAADIQARIADQDYKLKVLGDGGRVVNTEIFLKPLSRLPRITYDNLIIQWMSYRENISKSLTSLPHQTPVTDTLITQVDSLISANQKVINESALAANSLPGGWLTLSNWYSRLLNDLTEESARKKNAIESWFWFFIIADVVVLILLYYLFNKFVLHPLRQVTQNAASHHQHEVYAKNEIGWLTSEINQILEQLKDATEFVAAIGEGKLDYDYKKLDADYATGKNRLADSLISMQSKLRTLNEDEQRRNWANEGLTKFVDILRSSDDSITTLGDRIISSLVKYTNSNQGGLYILNDDDENNRFLELISLFAFDLKKYEVRKVRLGEGLLGQTFLEKETTVLNDIPQEYIRITSGLGEANPKSLLLVPLKVDKEVYGMVELASFKNYQLHEISFVEKLAETIAATLASVKVGQKNKNLIEQFQQQTEELRSQEEEMRQNMEELQATQEELSRKEQDYLARIQELESQVGGGVTSQEVQKLKAELAEREQDYQNKVRELERKLAEKPAHGDDWALAAEVEKAFRIQLEALKITREELEKRAD